MKPAKQKTTIFCAFIVGAAACFIGQQLYEPTKRTLTFYLAPTPAIGRASTPIKPGDASDYYAEWGKESERLFVKPEGIIERLRTESILKRHLPKPPAVIYDVGGGAGVYAFPLAQQGYSVHLFDFTPLHIEQASAKMKESGIQLAECAVGDARNIQANDTVADVVLLFGPLYSLQDKNDRIKALHEAYRILKPGGMLFAAAITRYSMLIVGDRKKFHDPEAATLMQDIIKTGKNNNPALPHKFFASAYYHNPEELEQEVVAAGFKDVQMLSVEGLSWAFPSLPRVVQDRQALDTLLQLLEMTEKNGSTLGASGHLMAIGKK